MPPRVPDLSRRALGRFGRDASGAVAVLFVILLPVLLLAAGMAIDLVHINAERRYVQAQADLAALSAAHSLHSAAAARGAARATVAANGAYPVFDVPDADIVFGTAATSASFAPVADQTSTRGVSAVQVFVTAPVQLFLLDLFMPEEGLIVRREAIAAIDPPRVSFALSNCLAELALFNGLLRPLIGADVDVLCSGSGIDVAVDLFETLGDFALEARLLAPSGEPLTYGDVLDADLPVTDILSVLLGRPVLAGAGVVRLGEVLALSEDLRALTIDTPVHALDLRVSDLVMMTAELMAMQVVALDAEVDLGPVAGLGMRVRVGEPRRLVIGVVPGSVDARAQTSQIRVEFDPIEILGLFTLSIDLRLANASAVLTDEGDACAADPSAVVTVFDPVDASLIDIDLTVEVEGLPLGSEDLGLQVATAQSRETRRVSFTRQQYDEDPVARLGPVGPAAEVAAVDLLEDRLAAALESGADALEDAADLQACTNILTCGSDLLGGLAGLLSSTATVLVASSVNIANGLGAEGNLTNAIFEDLIGLELARANLELLEVSCPLGTPRLIR